MNYFLNTSVRTLVLMSSSQEQVDQLPQDQPDFVCGSEGSEENISVKPKRVRKPKEPKQPFTAHEIGVDRRGNTLYRGPLDGVYYIKNTKDGAFKKVYKVVKEKKEATLEEGETVDSAPPKKKASRKRKANTSEAEATSESPSKKARTDEGSIIEADSPADACMGHLFA